MHILTNRLNRTRGNNKKAPKSSEKKAPAKAVDSEIENQNQKLATNETEQPVEAEITHENIQDEPQQKHEDENPASDALPQPMAPAPEIVVIGSGQEKPNENENAVATSKNSNEPHGLCVRILRTDRLKTKLYISKPSVQVFLVNETTGAYFTVADGTTYGQSLAQSKKTKASNFHSIGQSAPNWDEAILLPVDFDQITKAGSKALLLFLVIDEWNSMEANAETSTETHEQHSIAWAFLKVYHWYTVIPRVPYHSSLHISVSRGKMQFLQRKVQGGGLEERYQMDPGSDLGEKDGQGEMGAECVFIGYVQLRVLSVSKVYENHHHPNRNWKRAKTSEDSDDDDTRSETAHHDSFRPQGQSCKLPQSQGPFLASKGGCAFRLKFSPNGRFLAAAERHICPDTAKVRNVIAVYKCGAYKCLNGLEGHSKTCYDLEWSKPNGNFLLSASADSTARLWSMPDGDCINIMPHVTFVYCCAIIGNDGPDLGVKTQRFKGDSEQSASNQSGELTEGNNLLAITGCADGHIRVWRPDFNSDMAVIIQTISAHLSAVNTITLSVDCTRLFSGDSKGSVKIWSAQSPEKVLDVPEKDSQTDAPQPVNDTLEFVRELRVDQLMKAYLDRKSVDQLQQNAGYDQEGHRQGDSVEEAQNNTIKEESQQIEPSNDSKLQESSTEMNTVASIKPEPETNKLKTFIYEALFDYSGEGDSSELSFKKGDKIEVIDPQMENDWWLGRIFDSDGKTGYLPAKYVQAT